MAGSRPNSSPVPEDRDPQGTVHGRYFELCALATTGTLSDREWSELKSHLSECKQCPELLQKYREIARTGMPMLISEESIGDHHGQESWTPEAAKTDLFARIARGEQIGWSEDSLIPAHRSEKRSLWTWLEIPSWRVSPRYAAAFAIVAVVLLSIYRIGINKGEQTARRTSESFQTEASRLNGQMEQLMRDKDALDEQMTARNGQIRALSKKVERATADLAKLRASDAQAAQDLLRRNAQLAEADAQNSSVIAERDALTAKLQDAESAVASLKLSLDRLRDERATDLLHTASLEDRIADLSARLKRQDKVGAVDAQLLTSDRDIRELMGARDLYIADVFDVDPNGRTERPFGRIFYTRGKSLIFYAFDLDKQRGGHTVNAFQAWGRRGLHDNRPVNMGIFYLDSEKNRRWVLKFDDQDTLERIDTVFVTVEPKSGSDEPRGKPFLVASLRSEPNHP
jgi:hypothetical protein